MTATCRGCGLKYCNTRGQLCTKCYSYYRKVKTKVLLEMPVDELIQHIQELESIDKSREARRALDKR